MRNAKHNDELRTTAKHIDCDGAGKTDRIAVSITYTPSIHTNYVFDLPIIDHCDNEPCIQQ